MAILFAAFFLFDFGDETLKEDVTAKFPSYPLLGSCGEGSAYACPSSEVPIPKHSSLAIVSRRCPFLPVRNTQLNAAAGSAIFLTHRKGNSLDQPERNLRKQAPLFHEKNSGLGTIRPEDELLHPASFANVKDDSATETQYFGFSVPEANINAICYMWHHPNLHVCSGGLFVYEGVKDTPTHAELNDWRNFMNDGAIKNDLHEFRYDNGYGVKIIEPNKKLHITYVDQDHQNSVDIIAEAVQPAVMWGDGNHFEQTMSMKGELVLRGKRYQVDSLNVRDRSWGKPRPEALMPTPPMSWMVGAFNKDFAFNCTMFDQASNNPLLQGKLALPDDKALVGGWVYRDGKVGAIVKASKRVARGHKRLSTAAAAVELQFTDEHGRSFDLRGTLAAACPIYPWGNVSMVINMMRWECEGMVTHGDNQEAFWNDYLNLPNAC